jgi:hypothetical protein
MNALMTLTGAGSMTGHNAMVGGHGFGQTIRTINGDLQWAERVLAQTDQTLDATAVDANRHTLTLAYRFDFSVNGCVHVLRFILGHQRDNTG